MLERIRREWKWSQVEPMEPTKAEWFWLGTFVGAVAVLLVIR